MLVTKNDLCEGLVFKHKRGNKYKIVNYSINNVLLDFYSYQKNEILYNNTLINTALNNFNNGDWIIETPLTKIYECW